MVLKNLSAISMRLESPRMRIYLIGTSTVSESPESLSELEATRPPVLRAFSNSRINRCRRLGEQQQQRQPDALSSDNRSSPKFLFIHIVQNNTLQDEQLNRSLPPPHHPQ